MKTLNNKYRHIFLAFLFLGISYLIPNFFREEKSFTKKVPDTNIRKNLLIKKNKENLYKKFIPTDSTLYSEYLYDFKIDRNFKGYLPQSTKVIPNIYGTYSHNLRIKFKYRGKLTFQSLSNSGDYDISIIDKNGLPIFRTSNFLNKKDNSIDLDSGIYKIQINSTNSLDKFIFEYSSKANPIKSFNVVEQPTVKIKYGRSEERALERLILLAKKNASDRGSQVISTMPSGRIKALISSRNNTLDAEIGLSGRTIQHFSEGYPSIDVRLTGGNTYRGLSSFKLYQLSTKSGLKDFVFLSILKDMGFLVPRQELINLVVNDKSKGLFLLMENFSESTFTKQHLMDGNVMGLNTSKLFYNYPYGSELDLDYFYKIAGDSYPPSKKSFFLSNKFVEQLDQDYFAKYIAFASIYYSAHGLGVDDLRFYQDPVTRKFSPIPRDMNPGLGSQYYPFIRSFSTHLGWLSNKNFYTINPARNLEHQSSIDNGSDFLVTGLEDINNGLTDLHFSIITFLDSSENLALTNTYLDYFARNEVLYEKIRNRMNNALKLALLIEPKNKLLIQQYNQVNEIGIPFLGESVKNQIQKKPPIISDGNHQFLWNLRTSSSLNKDLMPSLISPFRDDYISDYEYKNELLNSFLLEKKIFDILIDKGFKPSQISISNNYQKNNLLSVHNDNKNLDSAKDNLLLTPSNFATFLGFLPLEESGTLALFIVRNATDDIENFTISRRKSLKRNKPKINYLFSLNNNGKELANIDEILKNKYNLKEKYRLLAFKFEPQSEPIFFRFNLPRSFPKFKRPKNAGWFGPSELYLPNSSQEFKNELGSIYRPEKIIKSKSKWSIPKGINIELKEDLIIPNEVQLTIEEGATIRIKEGKSIIVNGDLIINGNVDQPVQFIPLGSNPWGGIFVGGHINKKSKVDIRNVILRNFGSFPKTKINKMMLNGGISFYRTNLKIKNMNVENALSEDAINVIYSKAKIENLNIKNSFSDAIDLDYTDAEISNMQLDNNQGDGLDISGSLVKCSNCIFKNNKDKGVSIGEMSNFYSIESKFINNDMGLANKDQSTVRLSESLLEKNRIAIAEFIKKPYFGKPKSILNNNKYLNNKINYKWLGLYIY